ncbi:MAG: hypothetical protein OIF50_14585 [Flavobacteriaceae bacterium]|nr:hypothetical protein [Flavobacteriaceae bacterium]
MKVVLISILFPTLFFVFWQDLKQRAVSLWLFVLLLIDLTWLHIEHQPIAVALQFIGINIVLVSLLLCVSYLYTRIIKKQAWLNHSIGLGDILLLYIFALAFPTMSFVPILVFSLLFALCVHWFIPPKTHADIPLAGYMSLFLIGMQLIQLISHQNILYK